MAQIDSNRGAVTGPATDSRRFILAVVALIVVGLGAVAYFASTRGDDTATDGGTGAETALVTITGETLDPLPEGLRVSDPATDPDGGQIAPTLVGTSFDGTEVTIGPDGSAKAIYFLAHWCPHCQAEVPVVQDLIDGGRLPAGLEVYAVSTAVQSGQGNYPPSEWLESEGFTPAVIRDDADSSAFRAMGGGGFPFVVYLDAENRVVARSAGTLESADIERLWQMAATAA